MGMLPILLVINGQCHRLYPFIVSLLRHSVAEKAHRSPIGSPSMLDFYECEKSTMFEANYENNLIKSDDYRQFNPDVFLFTSYIVKKQLNFLQPWKCNIDGAPLELRGTFPTTAVVLTSSE